MSSSESIAQIVYLFWKFLDDFFKEYQIIMTTYDLEWFQVAKFKLGSEKWEFIKVFSDTSSNSFPQSIVFPRVNTRLLGSSSVSF